MCKLYYSAIPKRCLGDVPTLCTRRCEQDCALRNCLLRGRFFKRQQSKCPSTGGYLKLAIYLHKGVEGSTGTPHAAAKKEETDSA